jgi:peptide/nickel transport system permease protein
MHEDARMTTSSAPSRLHRIARWITAHVPATLAILALTGLVLLAVAAPWIAPYAPTAQDAGNMLSPPSAEHWLGTDDLGRDILSRLIYGAPTTVYACVLAVGVALLIGVPIGLVAGFFGGKVDAVISRIIDTFLAFPAIVLAIAVTSALGIGLTNSMISVGIVFFPQLARLVRARTLIVRQELYVEAARCFGASPLHILWRHVLPNTIQPVIVQVTLLLGTALLAEASLSFLGLGIQPPNPSWGAMLARAYQYMEIAPEQMYSPGLAILVTALAFNTLGESLRVSLDPTSRGR